MPFTLTPNMSLILPTVGEQPGPTYGTNQNSSFTIVDGHNHSPGSGVQITPSGLNINSDFPMGSNNLTGINSLVLDSLVAALSPSLLNRIYDVNGDLYFNDGLGNQIAITAMGAVAGTPGSIANLVSPASASYVALDTTFVFQSGVNTAGNLDAGSIKLRNITAGSSAITLSPPTLSSDYTITLPSLPASTSFVSISSSGNMATGPAVSGGITGANLISNINLPGTAAQVGGKNIVVANSGADSVALIWGGFNSSGALDQGFGCTVNRTGTGTYAVAFNGAFVVAPIIVGSTRGVRGIVTVFSPTTTSCTIQVYDVNGLGLDAAVGFTIMGARA